ncbi:lytic murein transglycosylase [Azohydromonas caseinilytica]|uniref:Lytic murein transglycosylase n=1 Tax=Azohydromonas caseinilytica TaxID=2728836 RepID=A0A848FIZ8_9BURK|nr:lytic murein transglycosylase [Azohydromonas caseinilytica]NML18269.1 lytic murein transglycosylase [Azohydromonas caseinilytica]
MKSFPGRAALLATLSLAALGAVAAEPEAEPESADNGLAPCIAALRKRLPEQQPQVSVRTFERYTRAAQDLRPVIEAATAAQPEFQVPIWDYLMRRVDEERIADGRALLAREAAALAAIDKRHGVDAATNVAVFGIETDYGRVQGRYPVVDATLSRACLNLDSAERRRNFFAALWLLQEGHVQPDTFLGSWAGAFGQTQFMPATFVAYMDGAVEGARTVDIVGSTPDALATTARYLAGLGWRSGLPWGVEVTLPDAALERFNAPESGHRCLERGQPAGNCRTLAQWAADGVKRADGRPLLGEGAAPGWSGELRTALLMPVGSDGPAWLVTPNYQAIWRYNRADAYGLAIGLLADALRGAPPPRRAWPTDDPILSRRDLKELQALLRRRGHCEVTPDGRDGPRTAAAIRAEEFRLELPETGRSGTRILARLKDSPRGSEEAPDCDRAAEAASAPR